MLHSQASQTFGTGSLTKGEIDHAIHADFIGPFLLLSRGGAKYALTMILGRSKFGNVRLLKSKDEISDNLLSFVS